MCCERCARAGDKGNRANTKRDAPQKKDRRGNRWKSPNKCRSHLTYLTMIVKNHVQHSSLHDLFMKLAAYELH
eukprot:825867-Pelagomonas_calceolata.AAC.10